MTTLLLNPSTTARRLLTASEHKYYTAVSLLANLLRTALDTPKSNPHPPPGLSTATAGIRTALDALRTDFSSTPPRVSALPAGDVLHSLTNPHALSLLRDAALAVRQSAGFLVAFNGEQQARDRSGKSNLHKEVLAEVKGLDEVAAGALLGVKGRVRELKEALGMGGWLDRMAEWTFEEDDRVSELVMEVVGEAEVEEWGSRVVESWREGVKGLGMVKME